MTNTGGGAVHQLFGKAQKDPLDVLKEVYGYPAFRGRQEEVIRHVVRGGDAVALFPTGAGKSVCYQIPALCRNGVGIVVSPLIALMRDQVKALKEHGIRAEALNSSMSPDETREVRRALRAGELKMLYVTPERIFTASFQSLMEGVEISLIAIDEAHSVSVWGHAFRPEYQQLGELAEHYPGVPRMALTATADAATKADIIKSLKLETAEVFTTSFDRPNISYEIVERDQPRQQLLAFLNRHRGSSGIVYCLSRAKVEETASWLCDQGIRSLPYHAGMDKKVKDANQDAFLLEEDLCLVATVAFGMGIDKPNVRYVAHVDLPGSVEAYYQETGRAGRDGLPSQVFMMYGMADVVQRRRMIDDGDSADNIKRVERNKLTALLSICETVDCRRRAILGYFGETHPGACGNCDTCNSPVDAFDGTEQAIVALAAVFRTGERFGTAHLVDVITGKSTDRTRSFRHEAMPVFGAGKETPAKTWQSIFRQLLAQGIVRVDNQAFGAIKLEESARAIFKRERAVMFRRDRDAKVRKALKGVKPQRADMDAGTEMLFEVLRTERMTISKGMGVAPYVVFPDATLIAMATVRPSTIGEMANIPGVGEAKLNRYGQRFLDLIADNPG
jgi:ATP-dependent DNA helicase RecQ